VALRHEPLPEGFDEGALPHARHAGNGHPDRIAAVGEALLHDGSGRLAVVRARALQQRDGLAQCNAVPVENAIHVLLGRPGLLRTRRVLVVEVGIEGSHG
jgi:hypothetical protein